MSLTQKETYKITTVGDLKSLLKNVPDEVIVKEGSISFLKYYEETQLDRDLLELVPKPGSPFSIIAVTNCEATLS